MPQFTVTTEDRRRFHIFEACLKREQTVNAKSREMDYVRNIILR